MHATLFDTTGGGNNIDLGVWPASIYPQASSVALDINNHGQAVGVVSEFGCCGSSWSVAVLFDMTGNGNNISLGTMGTGRSGARSINDNGEVVGFAGSSAFLWTSALGMIDLNSLIDPLAGFDLIDAYSINNLGQIATYGRNRETGQYHALLLSPFDENAVPTPGTLALLAVGLVLVPVARRQAVGNAGFRVSSSR